DMHADIRDFDAVALPRIVQLTNKSNQFNLTTRRYTQSEMEQVAADHKHIRLYGRLRDKFGDNGIVSVVIGEISGDTLHIELWLMSCRMKRDMELAMLDTRQSAGSRASPPSMAITTRPPKRHGQRLAGILALRNRIVENGDSTWRMEIMKTRIMFCQRKGASASMTRSMTEKLERNFQDIFDDDTLVITENTTATTLRTGQSGTHQLVMLWKRHWHEIQDAGSFRMKMRRNGRHYCCPCREPKPKSGDCSGGKRFCCLKNKKLKQKTKRLKCAEIAGHFRRFAV
ncbi:MAG: hypothetical protein ACLT29_09850, partial [Ruminococcus callidus]